jgi:hypothetical protein
MEPPAATGQGRLPINSSDVTEVGHVSDDSTGPSHIGQRCFHDPANPRLSPPEPIRKGLVGLPHILSLATERAKEGEENVVSR